MTAVDDDPFCLVDDDLIPGPFIERGRDYVKLAYTIMIQSESGPSRI
jgi:hypothetical protein